jgi:unconventional prefoldin RPB5 interactor 1
MKMMKKVMDLSEEGEEIEESGDALSDSNVQLGSGFGASCSGSGGNAKS